MIYPSFEYIKMSEKSKMAKRRNITANIVLKITDKICIYVCLSKYH